MVPSTDYSLSSKPNQIPAHAIFHKDFILLSTLNCKQEFLLEIVYHHSYRRYFWGLWFYAPVNSFGHVEMV